LESRNRTAATNNGDVGARKSAGSGALGKYLIFIAAGLLWLFAHGKWIMPEASWLAPLMMLYFFRRSNPVIGSVAVAAVTALATYISFKGVIPIPSVGYTFFCVGMGVYYIIPMLVDRYVGKKIQGFWSTLVYPLAYVSIEYIATFFNPFGSWNSWAYTQYGNLSLMQLLSVTGLWGITFVIMWTASVANWLLERRGQWNIAWKGLTVYTLVIGIIFLSGSAQLVVLKPDSQTVRVAALTLHDIDGLKKLSSQAAKRLLSEADKPAFREKSIQNQDDLLARSRLEAKAGAKIVLWAEGNAPVLEQDMDDFIDRAGKVAKEEGIYLIASIGELKESEQVQHELKSLTFSPEGKLIDEYIKTIQVPGWEAEAYKSGDGIHVIETEFGRMGMAICFDADYPAIIREAGQLDADFFILPSNEWIQLDPLHTHMAMFRAVENGFSLLRHTSGSYSLAVDYQGRALGGMHHSTSPSRTFVVELHTEGRTGTTVYAQFGDWFAWGNVGLLMMFTVISFRKNKRG